MAACLCSGASRHEPLRRRSTEQITNTGLLACKLHRLCFYQGSHTVHASPEFRSSSFSWGWLGCHLLHLHSQHSCWPRLSTLVFRFCVMSEVRTPAMKCLDCYLTLIIFTSSAFVIILELGHVCLRRVRRSSVIYAKAHDFNLCSACSSPALESVARSFVVLNTSVYQFSRLSRYQMRTTSSLELVRTSLFYFSNVFLLW